MSCSSQLPASPPPALKVSSSAHMAEVLWPWWGRNGGIQQKEIVLKRLGSPGLVAASCGAPGANQVRCAMGRGREPGSRSLLQELTGEQALLCLLSFGWLRALSSRAIPLPGAEGRAWAGCPNDDPKCPLGVLLHGRAKLELDTLAGEPGNKPPHGSNLPPAPQKAASSSKGGGRV